MWWEDIGQHAHRVHSQTGEDGVIEHILNNIGEGDRFCVEFGAGDGVDMSNTKVLRDRGWESLLMDGAPRPPRLPDETPATIHQAWITRENINQLLDQYHVPPVIDLLSIDIDGNDLWVWQAIQRKSRVVVIEYNPRWGPAESKTIRYNPDHSFDNTAYYGASLLALKLCGKKLGLNLVHYNGLNAFFVDCERFPVGFDLPLQYTPKTGWPIADRGRVWEEYR